MEIDERQCFLTTAKCQNYIKHKYIQIYKHQRQAWVTFLKLKKEVMFSYEY